MSLSWRTRALISAFVSLRADGLAEMCEADPAEALGLEDLDCDRDDRLVRRAPTRGADERPPLGDLQLQ
jgi:hypothetical protein